MENNNRNPGAEATESITAAAGHTTPTASGSTATAAIHVRAGHTSPRAATTPGPADGGASTTPRSCH